MHKSDRHALLPSSTRQLLRRSGLFALSVISIACTSTETTSTVTGVWGGRLAFLTPNDSFAFYLEQSGAEVEGWGTFYAAGSPRVPVMYGVSGTLSGGKLDLALNPLEQTGTFLPFSPYGLRGSLNRGQIDAVFGYDTVARPIVLRLSRPTATDLAGTWVLTSTTGTPAPAGLLDTIIANADGRAWRHREGDFNFGTQAMWTRRGDWMVIAQEIGVFVTDSVLIQSAELQRPMPTEGGSRTDHYTRVSTSAELP